MAVNTYNGYQTQTGIQGNNWGNNYNGNYTGTPINAPINPPPVNIGFVQGKVGASTYPMMSSNTTVYLFDVQDQTKFYVKSTDAFGMAMPLREFKYEEIVQPQTTAPIVPASPVPEERVDTGVTKEEFDELKAQLAALTQSLQRQPQQNKPRKENK